MSFSSLVLRPGVVSLACLSFLADPITALTSDTYILNSEYSGANFFDGFDFYTGNDPTHGFVTYVDQATAQFNLLISSAPGQPAYMGVDYRNTYNASTYPGGRTSVRISTKEALTHGLIISDIAHMPGGICGTWPAHWTVGSNWPSDGEIDIIEGVNSASKNLMSLHSSPNCTVAGDAELGTLQSNNCDTTVGYSAGCGVLADTTASYGTGFNGGNGGVYATQWTSDYIRIWFFETGSVPSDIPAGTPDPSLWGPPQANLQGSCDIDTHFVNHNIIFDTTFCGDYAGLVWSTDRTCSNLAPTCDDYVAGNPAAFQDAYWSINSVRVYKLAAPNNSTTSLTSTAAVSTSSGVYFSATMTSSISLSSALPQSSVLAPGMGNTTAATVTFTSTGSSSSVTYGAAVSSGSTAVPTGSTANSTSTSVPSSDPAVVGRFRYFGCVGSQSGYPNFTQVDDSAQMSIERCTAECASHRYAGVFNGLCFCADTLDAGTGTNFTQGSCNWLCPGNPNQICGGKAIASKRLARRQTALNSVLLSLYTNTFVENAVGAGNSLPGTPAAADGVAATTFPPAVTFGVLGVTITSALLTSAQPQSSVLGFGMGGGFAESDMFTTVLTTVYVDVCPTGLTTLTTILTTTQCSCLARGATSPQPVTIPMTAVEKVCTACGDSGAPSTLTVTVPFTATIQLGAAATSSTVAANATVSRGALRNAQPGLKNGTVASASVTIAHSTVAGTPAVTPGRLVAAATGVAGVAGVTNATGAVNSTGANSIAMFEGRARRVGANLGMVLLGAVAVMVL